MEATVQAVNEGKDLPYNHLKLLRFADRKGWKGARNFKGDNIADSPEEAKRTKKTKKEAEQEREAEKKQQKEAQVRRNRFG